MKEKLFLGIAKREAETETTAKMTALNASSDSSSRRIGFRELILGLVVSFILVTGITFYNPVLSQNADYKTPYNKANSMLVAGNFDEAARLYNLTIQSNPQYTEAYLGLGIAYKESKKYQDAYDAISKAIKLNPTYYQAYYNLGIVLENLNRNDEAIDAYDKFLEKVPGAERFSDAKQRISRLKNLK
jgi:tetratricopeptide (TPR) repeat protein